MLQQALAASVLAAALNAEEGSGSSYAYGGGSMDPDDALTPDDIHLCAKVRRVQWRPFASCCPVLCARSACSLPFVFLFSFQIRGERADNQPAQGSLALWAARSHPLSHSARHHAQVHVASCSALSDADYVDSTGAGDAFVGSILYSLVTGKSLEDMLRLGSVVAACKCTALGARPGLPYRKNLAASLL